MMRLRGLIVAGFVLALSAPALATGNVRIQQSDGSVQTYTGVTMKVANKKLTFISADKVSTVVISGASCGHRGDLIVCNGGGFTFTHEGVHAHDRLQVGHVLLQPDGSGPVATHVHHEARPTQRRLRHPNEEGDGDHGRRQARSGARAMRSLSIVLVAALAAAPLAASAQRGGGHPNQGRGFNLSHDAPTTGSYNGKNGAGGYNKNTGNAATYNKNTGTATTYNRNTNSVNQYQKNPNTSTAYHNNTTNKNSGAYNGSNSAGAYNKNTGNGAVYNKNTGNMTVYNKNTELVVDLSLQLERPEQLLLRWSRRREPGLRRPGLGLESRRRVGAGRHLLGRRLLGPVRGRCRECGVDGQRHVSEPKLLVVCRQQRQPGRNPTVELRAAAKRPAGRPTSS